MHTPVSQLQDYLMRWLRADGAQPPVILAVHDEAMREALITDTTLRAVCSRNKQVPCKQCHECRMVQNAAHPDIVDLRPTGATWRIADVRLLRTRLAGTSLTHRRVVVLRDAERFTGPAAPALLKMLEEPSATTRYLLVTQWPSRLLPTIRSRCQLLRATRAATPAIVAPPVSVSSLLRTLTRKGEGGLTEEEVASIAQVLTAQLVRHGPSPALRRAYHRLRDYYVVRGQRGNAKLAGETLVLSAATVDGMSRNTVS